jgi:hypothetical protein
MQPETFMFSVQWVAGAESGEPRSGIRGFADSTPATPIPHFCWGLGFGGSLPSGISSFHLL